MKITGVGQYAIAGFDRYMLSQAMCRWNALYGICRIRQSARDPYAFSFPLREGEVRVEWVYYGSLFGRPERRRAPVVARTLHAPCPWLRSISGWEAIPPEHLTVHFVHDPGGSCDEICDAFDDCLHPPLEHCDLYGSGYEGYEQTT